MRELKQLEKIVEQILRNNKLAREDDCYLILQVISVLYPYDVGKRFSEVMFNAKRKGISFESITRCRRKLQKKFPELKNEKIQKKRNEKQKDYIEYSKQD